MLLLKESKQRHLSEMDFHKEDHDIIRSSCSQMFLKIGFLKKFSIFTGKRMYWSLFLIKLMGFRLATLFKRDSQTGVFMHALCENFKFFYRTPLLAAFSYLIASRSVSYLARQYFFNLTFSFARNITLTFWLTYFSIHYFYSSFLTTTRLNGRLILS